MPILKFTEIPTAQSGLDRDQFELFAREFLHFAGFSVVEHPSRGADAGKDLIVEETRSGVGGKTIVRWLVSCKHNAHSGKSVSSNDDANIRDRLGTHKCQGFIAFYSTVVSSGLHTHLYALKPGFDLLVFDPESIERRLLESAEGRFLASRFFPDSFSAWDHPTRLETLSYHYLHRTLAAFSDDAYSEETQRMEDELKRGNELRDKMRKTMLKARDEIMKRPPNQSRMWKFSEREFVVHRLGDTSYPDAADSPVISNWFKLETFDFYNSGIEGILGIEYAMTSAGTRNWALLPDRQERDLPAGFRVQKVFTTGKIPWRNIRHFDPQGDDYYACPHLYCVYADNGMPYEGFGCYPISEDHTYEFELPIMNRVELDVLLAGSRVGLGNGVGEEPEIQ